MFLSLHPSEFVCGRMWSALPFKHDDYYLVVLTKWHCCHAQRGRLRNCYVWHCARVLSRPTFLWTAVRSSCLNLPTLCSLLTCTCGGTWPGAGCAGITNWADTLEDRRSYASSLENLAPVRSPSCEAEDSRSGEGLDRGCPRLQLASSSPARLRDGISSVNVRDSSFEDLKSNVLTQKIWG